MAENKNEKNTNYYLLFKAQDIPYLNTVTIGGVISNISFKKTDKGVEYIESKIVSVASMEGLDDILQTDKYKVSIPMRIPLFFYPVNDRMRKEIEYIKKNVKDKDFIVVRGFLDTIRIDTMNPKYTHFVVQNETVVEGLDLQHFACANFANKEMGQIPNAINYTAVTGVITGMETGKNRKGEPILHISLACPRIIPRNIGVQFGSRKYNANIDIVHTVFFSSEDAVYIKEHFTIGDAVIIQGRFITKFFGRKDIFQKLNRHFIIDAFAISLMEKTQAQKKALIKSVAKKMAKEEDEELKSTAQELMELIQKSTNEK